MTLDRIINMVVKSVVNRLVRLGVDRGIDAVAGKGKARDEMTGEERAAAQGARATARRARQAARLTRKLGR